MKVCAIANIIVLIINLIITLSVNLLAYLDIHVTATKQKSQNYFLRNLIFSKIVSYDKLSLLVSLVG